MDYKRIYTDIMQHFKAYPSEGYSEVHHIIPTCLGGPDTKENKVKLSARAHFVAHWLLWKMHPKHFGLARAFFLMAGRGSNKSGKVYEAQKRKFAALSSEINKGRKHSPETCLKKSLAQKGKPKSPEHRAALIGCQKGHKRSDEFKAKLSAMRKGKPQNPETNKLRIERVRAATQTPEFRAKLAAHASRPWTEERKAKAAATRAAKKKK